MDLRRVRLLAAAMNSTRVEDHGAHLPVPLPHIFRCLARVLTDVDRLMEGSDWHERVVCGVEREQPNSPRTGGGAHTHTRTAGRAANKRWAGGNRQPDRLWRSYGGRNSWERGNRGRVDLGSAIPINPDVSEQEGGTNNRRDPRARFRAHRAKIKLKRQRGDRKTEPPQHHLRSRPGPRGQPLELAYRSPWLTRGPARSSRAGSAADHRLSAQDLTENHRRGGSGHLRGR